MNERSIFLAAIDIEEPAHRSDYLDRACEEDAVLRRQVEELLRHHTEAGSFFETPAIGTTMLAPALPECLGTSIGPYKLLEQIGEGGMGVVYMAEQQQPVRRRVALKIIKPGMDTRQVIARFEAERQALALMEHPNIARILDAGVTGEMRNAECETQNETSPVPSLQSLAPTSGRPYFVMELVRGIAITDYCDQAKLPISERLKLFITVCRAVQHAHQKGIIHRDIKPSNVLVTLHDGVPVPKVIDFGVAKATGQQLTEQTFHTGFAQMIGTPAYMSPEQAEMSGLDIDTRSDVYSLGVLLYELLTGQTPFDRETLRRAGLDEFRRLVREVEPPPPSSRISTLGGETVSTVATSRASDPRRLSILLRGELDWVVMKALEKDRNRRYESSSAFAADVQRYLSYEPVQAGPSSVPYRLRKFLRRHKGPVVAATLVLLTMALGIAGTSWALVAEHWAKNESQQRLGQIEKRNDILLSIFANLEPRTEDVEVKPLRLLLAERLDQAAAALDEQTLGDPLAVARMQHGLGRAYVALNYPDKARPLLENALAIRRRQLGPDHADTLICMNNLALASADDRAEELLEEAVQLMRDKLGPDDAETLIATGNLAAAYKKVGKWDQALPMLEESVKRWKAAVGENHPDTLGSMISLAVAYQQAGRNEQILPLIEDTLRVVKASFSAKDVYAQDRRATLAVLCRDAGKLDEAFALFEEAFRRSKEEVGIHHEQTLIIASNLAVAYQKAGKLDKAMPLFDETIGLMRAKLGPEHPHTLVITHNLARALQQTGRPDRALPLLEDAFRHLQSKFGPEHPETLTAMYSLATAYEDTGKREQAIPLLEEAWRLRKTKLRTDHPDTLGTMDRLAGAYFASKKFDRSVPMYEELIRRREATIGRHHADTVMTLANLAVNYHDANRLQDADRMAGEFLARYEALPLPDRAASDWFVPKAILIFIHAGNEQQANAILGKESPRADQIGRRLLREKKYADAEPVLRACLAVREKTERDGWQTFNMKLALGESLLGQQKYAEAESLLLAGYEGMLKREAKIPAPGKIRLTEALERLVELYDATGKPQDAAKWRKELELRLRPMVSKSPLTEPSTSAGLRRASAGKSPLPLEAPTPARKD